MAKTKTDLIIGIGVYRQARHHNWTMKKVRMSIDGYYKKTIRELKEIYDKEKTLYEVEESGQ